MTFQDVDVPVRTDADFNRHSGLVKESHSQEHQNKCTGSTSDIQRFN